MNRRQRRRGQRGMVLIVTLLILLVIGFLASSVYETNLMQLRMAGNEQARAEAMQRALAIVDNVLADFDSLPTRGPVGYRLCSVGLVDDACDGSALVVDPRLDAEAHNIEYFVERKAPLEMSLPVMPEQRASSGRLFRAVLFEVSASSGFADRGVGATVSQGLLVRQVARHQAGLSQ